jgi:hypothetical protein
MTHLPINPFDNPLIATIEGVQDAKTWRNIGLVFLAVIAVVWVYNTCFKKEESKDDTQIA